jgi:hypothetical protein
LDWDAWSPRVDEKKILALLNVKPVVKRWDARNSPLAEYNTIRR